MLEFYPFGALGKVMGPAYKTIFAYLTANNIQCSANTIPFCIYHHLDWEALSKTGPIAMFKMLFLTKWHIEMGITSNTALADSAPIHGMKMPTGKFLRTIHTGPYHKVGDTYQRIQAEAKSQSLTLKNFSIEYYLNDPREVKADELKTDVMVPIQG